MCCVDYFFNLIFHFNILIIPYFLQLNGARSGYMKLRAHKTYRKEVECLPWSSESTSTTTRTPTPEPN